MPPSAKKACARTPAWPSAPPKGISRERAETGRRRLRLAPRAAAFRRGDSRRAGDRTMAPVRLPPAGAASVPWRVVTGVLAGWKARNYGPSFLGTIAAKGDGHGQQG